MPWPRASVQKSILGRLVPMVRCNRSGTDRRRLPARRDLTLQPPALSQLEHTPITSSFRERATMKWRIGAVTVTKIVELEVTGGSRFILPQATREAVLRIG